MYCSFSWYIDRDGIDMNEVEWEIKVVVVKMFILENIFSKINLWFGF